MALSACGTTNWGFPYRPDVQQGNWITSEQVAKLQQGMTREQVRFILGTPTIQDIFRTNRWDYPYYNKPGYGEEQERKFTVWFEGDSLVRWEGDQQPDRQPFQKADTGMTPGASTGGTAASTEGQEPAEPAAHDTSGAAQASPVAPATGPAPASETTGTQQDGSKQDAAAQGREDSTATPQAEAASTRRGRPLLNTSGSSRSNMGVPTPGRSSAEPLR